MCTRCTLLTFEWTNQVCIIWMRVDLPEVHSGNTLLPDCTLNVTCVFLLMMHCTSANSIKQWLLACTAWFAAKCEAVGMKVSNSNYGVMVLYQQMFNCPHRVGNELLSQMTELDCPHVLCTPVVFWAKYCHAHIANMLMLSRCNSYHVHHINLAS